MALDVPVLTIIIVLVPMLSLLLASPAFFLVRLDIPQVARLLRAMFSGYFRVLLAVGLLAAALNALDGGLVLALAIGLVTAFAMVWRRWVMLRLDLGLAEVLAGAAGAGTRLRRVHWMGMSANAAQTAATVALVPALVGAA